MRVVIVGGGSALAQPLIARWLARGDEVYAVCRNTFPEREVRCGPPEKAPDGIDLLVSMAGSTANAMLHEMLWQEWGKVVGDTLTSVWEALNACLPKMSNPSNAVVVGSVIGSTGGYGCANYAAAKAGLVGLVRAAANEWAAKGVCVNLLELGYCDAGMGARLPPAVREKVTRRIPVGRFADPEEVADAVEFLGRVRFMSGDVLPFAGGMR
jgi:NAD(P)-dependent dehydrogenase (short-subunit alcohol dehydrogenase family)